MILVSFQYNEANKKYQLLSIESGDYDWSKKLTDYA